MAMRAGVGVILGIGAILIATSVSAAGRYGSDYPVCMDAYDQDGSRTECSFTSLEQCRQSTVGSPGMCYNNPTYVAPPPEPVAAVAEPAPVKPAKKPAKSAKTAKLPPPAQPPAPTQQR